MPLCGVGRVPVCWCVIIRASCSQAWLVNRRGCTCEVVEGVGSGVSWSQNSCSSLPGPVGLTGAVVVSGLL